MVKQFKADRNYWGLYRGRFPTLYEQQCGFSYVPRTRAKLSRPAVIQGLQGFLLKQEDSRMSNHL